jgi:hypothetical protein
VKDSATSSPYYFKGSYYDWDKNETKVFCKVWCDDDSSTIKKNIVSEKEFLSKAHGVGVS